MKAYNNKYKSRGQIRWLLIYYKIVILRIHSMCQSNETSLKLYQTLCTVNDQKKVYKVIVLYRKHKIYCTTSQKNLDYIPMILNGRDFFKY